MKKFQMPFLQSPLASPARGSAQLKETSRLPAAALAALAIVTIAYMCIVASAPRPEWTAEELAAARLMRDAEKTVAAGRAARGWKPSPEADPNSTGLIGEEYGDYTTSLGNIYAKRTSTDPRMAALISRLYREAGAKSGDAVAIGASGSFPALTIASLAAAKAMGLKAVIIPSIGASTWGCDIEGFTNLDLMRWLSSSAVSGFIVAGVSMGGDDDRLPGLFPEARDSALKLIRESGYYFIDASSLRASVEERIRLYDFSAGGRRLACFVNVGGNIANMGSGNDVLGFQPGLMQVPSASVPVENRGVLHEMSARGVPTIHLLNLKGLCQRYSLPWDPAPLFNPDSTETAASRLHPAAAALVYILLVCAVIIGAVTIKKRRQNNNYTN